MAIIIIIMNMNLKVHTKFEVDCPKNRNGSRWNKEYSKEDSFNMIWWLAPGKDTYGCSFGALKAHVEMHIKLSSDDVVCCIYLLTLVNTLSVYVNNVYPDRIRLDIYTKRLLKHFNRRQQQNNCIVIGTLRVKRIKKTYNFSQWPLNLHFVTRQSYYKSNEEGKDQTIRYHTWPRRKNGTVTKTQENITHNRAIGQPFPSSWPQGCKEQKKQYNKDKHDTHT